MVPVKALPRVNNVWSRVFDAEGRDADPMLRAKRGREISARGFWGGCRNRKTRPGPKGIMRVEGTTLR